jgi:oxygen-dependent protoporphyrinogen oxidase
VIGGGISGLSCAWRLRKLGLPALLLERSPRFGGVIATREMDGFRFDIGPQSFLAGEALQSLIAELNLTGELVKAPRGAPRYIYYGGQLVPAPFGPIDLLRTKLIGSGTKARLISEPFRRSRPPQQDESIAAFVRRKFGADLLANLVAPFVSGVYAGDPERLSLRSALPAVHRYEEQSGSVIRGAIKAQRDGGGQRAPLCNFTSGVSALTEALGTQLGACARRGVEMISIRPRSTGARHAATEDARTAAARTEAITNEGFEVTYQLDGATQTLDAAAVVIATPADAAGQLLAAIEPRFADTLSKVEYAGVAQVSAGYRIDRMSPRGIALHTGGHSAAPSQAISSLEGFGFLVPRAEGLRVLGAVWNSALFKGRAPEVDPSSPQQLGSFTSFLGGATDPELCRMEEDEIARIARADFAKVMGTTDAPVVEHVSRWQRAIPQYNLGHERIVASLKELCEVRRGIFLAGNYLTGPSIGACVEQSNHIAAAVARFIASPPPPPKTSPAALD